MPKEEINGANFYYTLEGSGPPVVYICGYTVGHNFSPLFIEQMRKKFSVLTFDNRGVGQTRDDGRELNAKLMATDTRLLLERLGIKNPYVIGESMGGAIAQELAIQMGDRLSKLIIHVSTAKWRKALLYALESLIDLREKHVDFESIFKGILSWMYGERVLREEKIIREIKESILKNAFLQSIENQKRQFQVLKNFDGRKKLSLIQVPTLISYAKEDLVALPHEALFMHEKIPNSELYMWEGGHNLFFDFPTRLADRFTQFFLD